MATTGIYDDDGSLRVSLSNTGSGSGSMTNPSIVGAEYQSTPPTETNGTTDALQIDGRGNLRTLLVGATVSGTDGVANNILSGATLQTADVAAIARPLVVANYNFNGTSWDRGRGDSTGTYVVSKGSGSIATGQVTVATTAGGTQIVAARPGRSRVTITNLGTNDLYVGVSGLTVGNGQLLVGTKGASITINTSAAVFGIAGTNQAVSFIEEF